MNPVRSPGCGRWTLCLLLAVVIPGAEAGPLQVIAVDPTAPGEEPLDVWMQSAAVPERIRIDLGLGDDVGGRVLRVRPAPGRDANYRVQVQFETSAAIGGEGPHIDLLDWKHCRSDWRSAPPEGRDGFRFPAADAVGRRSLLLSEGNACGVAGGPRADAGEVRTGCGEPATVAGGRCPGAASRGVPVVHRDQHGASAHRAIRWTPVARADDN